MKHHLLTLALSFTLMLGGCGSKDSEKVAGPDKKLSSIDDVRDKKIGVLMGSIHDSYATKNLPKAEILQYQSVSDLLLALNTDKVDAGFFDHVSLKEVLRKNEKLGMLTANVFTVPIAAAFNKENTALMAQFNAFLKEIRSNGTYDSMVDRWLVKDHQLIPDIPNSGVNGILQVGIVSDLGLPFTILKDGKLEGFDVELSQRFAASLGKEFVAVDMPFGSMIAAVSTRRIDFTTCSMMITEERKKQINFSDPYMESGVSLIASKDRLVQGSQDTSKVSNELSFFDRAANSFHSNIILEKRYLLIINGLIITIAIALLSAFFGSILGGLICFLRMSKHTYLSFSARMYISLLRGIPVLVLLMIIYYVVFASVNINPVLVATIAFGLNFAAYVSEMFRTSIESIDKGQKEAGIAGGFTRVQTFRYIIMPQAVRRVLPVYKGEFISLVKMTSVVGYIAVQDLTKAGDIIRSRTFDAFFPLIMAAVIYLALAWLLTLALDYVQVSVEPKRTQMKREVEAKG